MEYSLRTSNSGGKKPDDIVKEIIKDINQKVTEIQLLDNTKANQKSILVNPEENEPEEKKEEKKKEDKKRGKKKKGDKQKKSRLGNFLLQECDIFNNLLQVIISSLHSLELAVNGTEVMSPLIELVYHSFLDGLVPKLWRHNSYLSLKPLASWINDLILRVKFMSDWLYNGPQLSYWISAFLFPQGFLFYKHMLLKLKKLSINLIIILFFIKKFFF